MLYSELSRHTDRRALFFEPVVTIEYRLWAKSPALCVDESPCLCV